MLVEITHREVDSGVILIQLAGRLMLGKESQQMETLVMELLAKGHRKFIFDLAGLTHIDSTGIGRFIFSLNKVMQAGGKMMMAGATGHIREGFKVTRLDTGFKFFDTVEAARQALG